MYKFYVDCGRMGSLTGIFIAEERINDIIGSTIYFGEVLGKHSDISVDIEKDNIKVITEDQDFIEKAEKYGISSNGINPSHYIHEDDEYDEDK